MRATFRPTLSSVPRSAGGHPVGPTLPYTQVMTLMLMLIVFMMTVGPIHASQRRSQAVFSLILCNGRLFEGPNGHWKVPTVTGRSPRSLKGPHGHLKVPTVTGRSPRSFEGPNGHWKVPTVTGRSQRSLESPNGHWKVPMVTGRSQRSLEGPNGHWKVPMVSRRSQRSLSSNVVLTK